MIGSDSRLVQTAVIGSRNSGRAIILPTDADELIRWRRRHPAYTYWCGTQLGGCGNELSDRLYRDKVCHFAHRPHTSCHRTATGAASADHLFIKDDLAAWVGRNRLKAKVTSRDLGSGPGDAVDFRVGAARQQHVRFQFSRLAHAEWNRARRRLSGDSATLDWVFGPGAAPPETMEELYDEYGYLLRFRFETHGAVRRIRLRAEDPRRSTDWVPLDACAMTPAGLRIPGVEPRRRSSAGPAAAAGSGRGEATVLRSREEQVLALKEALVSAARFRTRPTWESLSRTAGSDLTELSVPDRVGLLVLVDQACGSDGSPLLSALIRTGEGDPPSHVGDVVAAVGCGVPATATVLKRWCQREADRAFAVHGVPSRTAPPRLPLTLDGHLAAPQTAEPAQHQTIVHVKGGPVRQTATRSKPESKGLASVPLLHDTEIRHSLRSARQGRGPRPRYAAALMARAEEALTRLPEPQRTELVAEMATTRRWLDNRPGVPAQNPKQSRRAKKAANARKAGAATQPARAEKKRQGKKAKDPLQGARPLPGVGDARPKKRPT
ncbi:competence protein CoiA family protein [Streptomyces zaomyceticus]|uniref:competence protein CoiA family protein n=1 Tax=Streptomyces zaomyceticus TaxID=68286 RepID=UPI0037B54F20